MTLSAGRPRGPEDTGLGPKRGSWRSPPCISLLGVPPRWPRRTGRVLSVGICPNRCLEPSEGVWTCPLPFVHHFHSGVEKDGRSFLVARHQRMSCDAFYGITKNSGCFRGGGEGTSWRRISGPRAPIASPFSVPIAGGKGPGRGRLCARPLTPARLPSSGHTRDLGLPKGAEGPEGPGRCENARGAREVRVSD